MVGELQCCNVNTPCQRRYTCVVVAVNPLLTPTELSYFCVGFICWLGTLIHVGFYICIDLSLFLILRVLSLIGQLAFTDMRMCHTRRSSSLSLLLVVVVVAVVVVVVVVDVVVAVDNSSTGYEPTRVVVVEKVRSLNTFRYALVRQYAVRCRLQPREVICLLFEMQFRFTV